MYWTQSAVSPELSPLILDQSLVPQPQVNKTHPCAQRLALLGMDFQILKR